MTTKPYLLNARLTLTLTLVTQNLTLTLSLTLAAFWNGGPSEWQANTGRCSLL